MRHENSISALREERIKLDRRCSEVLGAIHQLGTCTDRQIKDFLGYEEMNSVRPRITELKKLGLVHEAGKIKCPKTGKSVRVVRITPAPGYRPEPMEYHQAELFATGGLANGC